MHISLVPPRWMLLPLSIVAAGTTAVWTERCLGGVGRTGRFLFNWHPLLLSLSAFLLLPHASLLWSGLPLHSPPLLRARAKCTHAALHVCTFTLVSVGIGAAFTAHQQQHNPSFASAHSWAGVLTLVVLKANMVGGILAALAPRWRVGKIGGRVHRSMGQMAVGVGFMTAGSGFVQIQTKLGAGFEAASLVAGYLAVLTAVIGVGVMRELGREGLGGGVVVGEGTGGEKGGGGKVVDVEESVGEERRLGVEVKVVDMQGV